MRIELISNKGKRAEFDFEHALNLLQNFKTWSLPKDSEYKFENNDIVKRRKNKRVSEDETAQSGDSNGDTNI